MAYWIAHLRIADAVLNRMNLSVDKERYFVGAIATDGGQSIFDESGKKIGYNPPRHISHWTDDKTDWDIAIHYSRFYDTYVKNECDFAKKSFYLGYFVHLISDALWIELVSRRVIESFKTTQEYDIKAKSQVRQEWFNVDLIFLKENPDFKPLRLLESIENFENIYLDYFLPRSIQLKIDEIVKIYSTYQPNLNRAHNYFTYEDCNRVITTISMLITMDLLSR